MDVKGTVFIATLGQQSAPGPPGTPAHGQPTKRDCLGANEENHQTHSHRCLVYSKSSILTHYRYVIRFPSPKAFDVKQKERGLKLNTKQQH